MHLNVRMYSTVYVCTYVCIVHRGVSNLVKSDETLQEPRIAQHLLGNGPIGSGVEQDADGFHDGQHQLGRLHKPFHLRDVTLVQGIQSLEPTTHTLR